MQCPFLQDLKIAIGQMGLVEWALKAPDRLFGLPRQLVSPTSLAPCEGCIRVQGDRTVRDLPCRIVIVREGSGCPAKYAPCSIVVSVDTECQPDKPQPFGDVRLRIGRPSLTGIYEVAASCKPRSKAVPRVNLQCASDKPKRLGHSAPGP